jgi:hypothetical protein
VRKLPLLTVLLVAAPLAAVLPPPAEGGAAEDLVVAEGRGASAPERPSRIYAVQGPRLKARLSLALSHARSLSPPTDFWVGYTCDAEAETGTASLALELETRRAVVLIRYRKDESVPERIEVCSVDKPRGEPGLPVYWLGRAPRAEGFTVLRALARGTRIERDRTEVVTWPRSSRVPMLSTLKTSASSPSPGLRDGAR